MKTFKVIFTIFIFAISTQIFSQTAAEMKAWTEYMTPGLPHEMLAKCDGDWSEEITMWMAPGQEPTKSSASCTNKMILGGRYQYSTHSGSMWGMPFEGISIIGYDNSKKMYVSSWVDNMGTGIMNMEGTYDEATKTMNLKGKCSDPTTGKDMDVRETFKIVDDKNQLMEMFMSQDGNEFKTMEIKLTKNNASN